MGHYAPGDLLPPLSADAAAEVERILALSNEELASLRGTWCPECKSRDCDLPDCDRCQRHAHTLAQHGDRTLVLCQRCAASAECASCGKVEPRYQMGNAEGEMFCKRCYGQDPMEAWL